MLEKNMIEAIISRA